MIYKYISYDIIYINNNEVHKYIIIINYNTNNNHNVSNF